MLGLTLVLLMMEENKPTDMVEVRKVCPAIRVELRYMTKRNGIGRAVYQVNWISQEETAIAVGTLRHPDAATTPLKFEYD